MKSCSYLNTLMLIGDFCLQKTGKAVLALKRMAILSKSDNSACLSSPVDGNAALYST